MTRVTLAPSSLSPTIGVADPSGVVVYCFKPIAPSAEFAPFFKEAQT